jgi:uncharacterized protein YbbK (DUF523 family)
VGRTRLRLGVSACLLGREVRYDGRHKRDPFLVEVLGPFVEWVEVCPEAELGLGVPREPIRLVGRPDAPRLVAERSGADLTDAMARFAEARVRELARLDLDGFVTKEGSPSCGLVEVRVHPARGGRARRAGVGLFAAALARRLPGLPIAEESELADPAARERFVERILRYAGEHPSSGTRRRDLAGLRARLLRRLRSLPGPAPAGTEPRPRDG